MKQTTVITGATSGLGLSLAKVMLRAGYQVIGISRTKKHWQNAIRETRHDKNFHLIQSDVSSPVKVKKFAGSIFKKFKQVDLLINNAGYGGHLQLLEKTQPAEFIQHLNQNLISTFLVCRQFIPKMKQNNSIIVNISSMAGKRAVPSLSAYSASKFGVVALSQAIAKENASSGLKCITVCPGGMNTVMRKVIFGQADSEKQQSPDFVAGVIADVIQDKIQVESGGDIVIRHGKITAINPCPGA